MLIIMLYPLKLATFPLHVLSGGMKEPSVYMLCSGLYVGRYGRGIVLWVGILMGNFMRIV